MEFMDGVKDVLDNTRYTENGATGYKTIGSELVDFFYKVSSFRNESEVDILNEFATIKNNPYVLRLVFYIRDCHQGLGERRLFRVCIGELLKDIKNMADYDKVVVDIFDAILKYGRADDIFYSIDFTDTETTNILRDYLLDKIAENNKNYTENKPINIMFKWFPSENTSSEQTRYLAKNIRNLLNMSSKEYRKMLSKFRSKLNITENYMCANDWKNIDYNKVPSKANLIYKDAFYRHDMERRTKYLNDLASGKSYVKINSAVNYPYEIYHKYFNDDSCWAEASDVNKYDETLEQLWKNLNQVPGLDNTMVVCDGSGSMNTDIGNNTNITTLDVSRSLAIYCSEQCHGAYKDKFITFSSKPEFVDLSKCENLHDKILETVQYNDCSNTAIERVFDLILKTAIKNKCGQKDLPKQILIISDMEFDVGSDYTGNPIESAQQKFKAHGYDVPKLIFWNVCSRTKAIPLATNKLGVLLVSGFSQNVVSLITSGETDPEKALLLQLENYSDIPLKI